MKAFRRPRSILFWLRLLVAIVVLPGWAATAVMIAISYEREGVTLQNRAIGTARALRQAVERDLAGAEAALKVLALSPYLATDDLAGFHRQSVEVLRDQAGNGIVLADVTGRQVMSTIVPFGQPLPQSGVPTLVRTIVQSGKPATSDFYRGATSGVPQVAVGVPVLRDGEVAYVLTMGILPVRLGEILRAQAFQPGWIAAIYDSQGTIVARTEAPDEFVGRKGPPAMLRRIAEVPEDAITVNTLEGIPVFAGFSRSAILGWTVVIGIPRASLAARLETSLGISIAGAGALLLLGLVLAQLFSLRIARSIGALTEPALALASGSSTPSLITPVREVNEVGAALTKAARLLDERLRARDTAERAEREMARAKEAAERNSEAKSQFLAMMSHELRTPLHGILGFAQLMDGQYYGTLTTKQKEFVDAILFSGNHLLELINDVLELSKIEAGRITVSIERVDLTPVMKSVIATLTPAAEAAGIALRAGDFGQALPPVKADRVRLAQCLLNLGTNAIKYNRPDGSVTFSYGVVDGRARISVTDTGPGIPRERQTELFQAFNRLGMERSGVEGTGVGLALTRRLTELMGGKIGFVSSPGQGSCFWLDMPLHEETRAPTTLAAGVATPPQIGTASILYVEDNPSNILLMRNVIATLPGVRLIEAMSGEVGLAAAARYRPDLIIVDINLPDTNGIALLKRLKALPGFATTPVLALSATASPAEGRRGLEAGFYAYLTKPIDVVEFLKVVGAAIAGAKAADTQPTLAVNGDVTPT